MSSHNDDFFAGIFDAVVVSIPILIVLWATIASHDPNPYDSSSDKAYWFVFLVVFGIGLTLLVAIWRGAIKLICKDCSDLRRLERAYHQLLWEESLSANREERNG